MDFFWFFIGAIRLFVLKNFIQGFHDLITNFITFIGHLNCEFHEYTSVACAIGASVLRHPQVIFPSKTWFFWNLF